MVRRAPWCRTKTGDTVVQAEKRAARCGSEDDDMRLSSASFARVLERCTDALCMHFLSIFQEDRSVRKTCNQLVVAFHLGQCEQLLRYGKLATSSVVKTGW